jgi:hypothetical protein
VRAAHKAHAAGMKLSVIALLGVGGTARSQEHAEGTADLVTAMDPAYFAALTTSVVPDTPLARMRKKGFFELPGVREMLGELRAIVDRARPTDAMFRTNHASNYLPLGGRCGHAHSYQGVRRGGLRPQTPPTRALCDRADPG